MTNKRQLLPNSPLFRPHFTRRCLALDHGATLDISRKWNTPTQGVTLTVYVTHPCRRSTVLIALKWSASHTVLRASCIERQGDSLDVVHPEIHHLSRLVVAREERLGNDYV